MAKTMTKSIFKNIILLSIFFLLSYSMVSSTSSTDYTVDPENATNSFNQQSTSTDYIVSCQQVGDLAIGQSTDTSGNIIIHGMPCATDLVKLDFIFTPQGRYGPPLTNDQTKVTIEVRPVGGNANSFLFSDEVTTLPNGSYTGLILNGVASGIYDVTAKGWNTLRIKKTSVTLTSGNNFIDFTNGGLNKAIAGDVDPTDRSGVGSDEKGDNEINASDYSTIVGNYDLTGPSYDRYDLDQFGNGASAADYSLLVFNYGLTGDN